MRIRSDHCVNSYYIFVAIMKYELSTIEMEHMGYYAALVSDNEDEEDQLLMLFYDEYD